MSKLTEVLKLFCYDPETDGNLTFNVTEALTKNWEKIDQLVLLAVAAAVAYNPSGTYVIGDYCTNDGNLYKCNTPIESGETWNAAHWTETTVAAELAEVRTSLSNKAESSLGQVPENDLLTWADKQTISGAFGINPATTTDGVPAIGWYIGKLDVNAGAKKITLTESNGAHRTWTNTTDAGEWTEWVLQANATPPQEGNIPVIDGMREVGQCMYFQQQDGTTFFFAVAGAGSDGAQISNDQSFAVTPIGARPKVQYYYPAVAVSGSDILKGYVVVNPDGTIEWVGNAVPYPGYIVSFGAFVAAKEN